jgi:hypothetical protein
MAMRLRPTNTRQRLTGDRGPASRWRGLGAAALVLLSWPVAAQQAGPYTQFGYQGRVLRTPQERRQQMLLIANPDTTATVASIGLEPQSGTYYLFGRQQQVLAASALRPEQVARFLSLDPLAKDYPGLTPYQFGANTPVQAIDLDGLEAWQVTRQWEPSDIKNFATYSQGKIKQAVADKVSEDCANFALRMIVGYASANGLPLTLRNAAQTFDMSSTKFRNTNQYLATVKSNIQAADMRLNTYGVPQRETQAGDMEVMRITINNGHAVDFNHVVLFQSYNKADPVRSVIAWGNLDSSDNSGQPIQMQPYNWVRSSYNDGKKEKMTVITGDMNSRWNVLNPTTMPIAPLAPVQPVLAPGTGTTPAPRPAPVRGSGQ